MKWYEVEIEMKIEMYRSEQRDLEINTEDKGLNNSEMIKKEIDESDCSE